jgi:hypothetical protein
VGFFTPKIMITNNNLSIPNPKNDGSVRLMYNLENVIAAESRLHEIAFVTPSKGPELLTLFSVALRDLSTYVADLQYQCALASKKKRERRAVVVTEIIPVKLAEKKLSNNDTNREAVVELDPEFSAWCDVEAEVEAAYTYVREKFRNMESHLNAVKRALDVTGQFYQYNNNPSLNQSIRIEENLTIGKANY